MRLEVEVKTVGSWDVITLSGFMTESTAVYLDPLFDSAGEKCKFNFKNIMNVNSCGTRDWINFLRIFRDGRTIVFEECSAPVVDQINLLSSWSLGCEVRSVYGTYHCDACEIETEKLFEKDRNMPKSGEQALELKCKKCNGDMEITDSDVYFLFNK